jgi:dihydroorotate dehydrogenase
MYKKIILPFLFRFDAEQVHHFVCSFIKFSFKIPLVPAIFRKLYSYENPVLERTVFGITFKNPVGLAAGFDKNADLVDELSEMGFGFIEIGTVTPEPQDGNEKPRLFRLKPDHALVNRMGFNNEGVKAAAQRLRSRKTKLIIGGNIGKNKLTPNENALDDYLKCFDELHDTVDYFVVNVSSPNTPGLRDLQEKEPLKKILSALKVRSQELGIKNQKSENPTSYTLHHTSFYNQPKPILLKIAPDLTNSQLDDIVEIILETGIAGVIATNTTISRDNLATDEAQIKKIGAGGLSGTPLTYRSTEVIRYICQKSNNAFPVIGVGGITSADDALEKLRAGASLVQLYTAFIYEGPSIAKQINTQISLRFTPQT